MRELHMVPILDAEHTQRMAPRPRREPHPASPDHDLPVLAAMESSTRRPDWESLMDDGVQPTIVLGGERRLRGRR
jgi:hypothetical protein